MRLMLCFLLPLIFSTNAWSDQNDPRLQDLFEIIKNEPGANSRLIEQEIWNAWYTVPLGASQAAFDEAKAALNSGQYQRALNGFEQFAEMHPDYAEVFNQLAIVHFVLGDDAASIDAIRRTLELEPNHFGALAGLAQIWFRNMDYVAAVEAADQALKINPTMTAITQLRASSQAEIEKESV